MRKSAKVAELDSMVADVKTRGSAYKTNKSTRHSLAVGGIFVAFGLWLGASSFSLVQSSGLSYFVPNCTENPYTGLIAGLGYASIGLLFWFAAHLKPDEIYLTDQKLTVAFRNRRPATIAWWDMTDYFEFYGTLFLRLRSGKWRVFPLMPMPDTGRFEKTLLLVMLLSKHLSQYQTSLTRAYEMTKLDIVGPGIVFPLGEPQKRENRTRLLLLSLLTIAATLLLAAKTIIAGGQIFLLAFPIAIAFLVGAVTYRRARLYHSVTLGRKNLKISLQGDELDAVAVADIKYAQLSENGLFLQCFDKAKNIELRLDVRSARLLQLLIETTKGFGELAAVTANQRSKTKAAA